MENASVTPVLLLILDGFGERAESEFNAINQANMPNWRQLKSQFAFSTLDASEHAVGLPRGQFGNSEVGHMNIGAGRIIQQDISRIDSDIEAGTFAQHPELLRLFSACQTGRLHVMGLLSDGGVHSHEAHIYAVIQAAQAFGLKEIFVHAFLDGRDTPPKSAHTYLARLNEQLAHCPNARLVSLVGRYWVMDRDLRWERVEPAYRLLVEGEAAFAFEYANDALEAAYARGENDEFVQATRVGDAVRMLDGDGILFMNFRADRARELTTALTDPNFSGFSARQPNFARFTTLTRYGEAYALPVMYAPQSFSNTFGEYLAKRGLKQLRIAETEKYPHVTYFFNGGEETVNEGEVRILVPSPKVATYDLLPQMSAFEVTEKIEAAIESREFDAIICNFANGDMVGHTGVLSAAIEAVETLDACIGRCVAAMRAIGGEVLITADHGNCEQMFDEIHQQPHTQHTLNRVPCVYVGRAATLDEGALRDIAPTLLTMMGLPIPEDMTGKNLLHFK